MAKKKKEYKISLLGINILCIISTILGVLGIVMFCSMPELREVPGIFIGAIILGFSIMSIVVAIMFIIVTIVALNGEPKKFQSLCIITFNSREDKSVLDYFKLVAIITIILVIPIILCFFF